MEPMKATLCLHCTLCPEVQITEQGVTIGEDANAVRLSHAEWNELVDQVRRAGRNLTGDGGAPPSRAALDLAT